MSTPRTAEVLIQLMEDKGEIYEGNCPEKLVKLARQLETELEAMTKERDEIRDFYHRQTEDLKNRFHEEIESRQQTARAIREQDDAILKAEREKVAKLRDALVFYAGNFPNDDLGDWQERICEDEGDKARQALY